MKRFEFGLEKVRLWRNEQADLEEMHLRGRNVVLQRIDSERQAVENELEIAERTRDLPGVEAQDLVNLESFRQYTRARLQQIAQRRKEAENQVIRQRQKVVEARRACELLNKLKERAWAEWNASRDKEQEDLAAEHFLATHWRQ